MLINEAFAQAAAPAQTDANLASLLPMLGILVLFYFLLIRPQWKRAREQKQMVEALQRGDEVITNGGILGLILNVSENYVIIEIAPTIEVTILKSSVQTLLPKGTLKTIDPKSNKLQKAKPAKTTESKTDDAVDTSETNASEAQKTTDNK
ncbi:preprotein translocase subunit YajC [Nitrosomonas sp. JL21]|uniref:preprotein translocase subunit YajC n=1 Tax=Nitrosomonas sp. JL21 TaxID=153949 RepID=UPI0013706939|nr:preprotein translocase subunit YajC [Nitrosomonas sp. JL21]MBL8497392.1 preprotein translocase subunit YajC [Nitrosomonas sp.]MXS78722.1 preprotein translocase subunit YajC [Nitrosomonas sp. JL21]